MKDNHLYNALLGEIRKKIPKSSELTRVLVDILSIEKEAVYRRLRGEVPFTFHEIALITKTMGISLDTLIGIETEKSQPFRLKLPEFVYPEESDYIKFEDYINFLKSISSLEGTEMGVVTNTIPQELFSNFYYLLKFNVLKWQYYYHNQQVEPFEELSIPTEVLNTFKSQFEETKKIATTNYVFDKYIFNRIVQDIEYFKTIKLLNDKDIAKIKKELGQFLDYLEALTIIGKFPETDKKVYVYITELDITTTYSYMRANDIKFSLIKTFILTSATSLDEMTFEKMKDWIQATIKASTLITGTYEQQRILYFESQRDIINKL